MGTHISRVKSVDLDAWTDDQLQNMLRWGNARANKFVIPHTMESRESNTLKDIGRQSSHQDMFLRKRRFDRSDIKVRRLTPSQQDRKLHSDQIRFKKMGDGRRNA